MTYVYPTWLGPALAPLRGFETPPAKRVKGQKVCPELAIWPSDFLAMEFFLGQLRANESLVDWCVVAGISVPEKCLRGLDLGLWFLETQGKAIAGYAWQPNVQGCLRTRATN
jgi:hypothetical protein